MGIVDSALQFLQQSWKEAWNVSSEELFSFHGAFLPSVGSIVVSELGDKTFFIAALMSMKYNPFTVFIGAGSALYVMTILSALGGTTLPLLVDKNITKWISICLFFYFGITQIYNAYYFDENEENELAEVEEELGIQMHENKPELSARTLEAGTPPTTPGDAIGQEAAQIKTSSNESSNDKMAAIGYGINRWINLFKYTTRSCLNPVLWQSFTWTFVAEWGDRSQIATIALATNHNWVLVSLGAIIGHSLCTGLACFAGRLISEKVSERLIGFIAGTFFLIFGVLDLILDEF